MSDHDSAFLAERQIKGWSRAKKEALIAQQWDLLRWLAKKANISIGGVAARTLRYVLPRRCGVASALLRMLTRLILKVKV